ncbi:hypothetical protein K493DRAFT_380582 [Basidiobolus meristosporus CBS 931.73]|uniref:RNI-like protein n=1 Tax=Basidiobolus meristosporus CBS 931.73 TaxID=1314790 RepID=A0A1Y1XXQ1_9FUNG|nr:hypothetical protein K493DRAFT_380582 [Basidiobolus meristosporus CBS 931.73]|eukprot:ORX90530.1 hypothetical protein K493DRAFT_380582 [Basidiobolus meristosporus CBS 931.73]
MFQHNQTKPFAVLAHRLFVYPVASYIKEWTYETKSLTAELLPLLPNLRNIGYMIARTLRPEKFSRPWHLRRIDHLDYCATDGPALFQNLVELCPNLERLTIRINSLNGVTDFTDWCNIRKVNSLKHLKIINSEYGVEQSQPLFIQSFTSRFPNLQSLDIESFTFNGHELDGLSTNCRKLDSLSLATNTLDQHQIDCLANELQVGVGERVNKLQLSVSRFSKDDLSLLKIFTSLKSLSELSLHRFELDDEALEALIECTQGTLAKLRLGFISPASNRFFFYLRSAQLWDKFFARAANSLTDIAFNDSFGNFRDMISCGVAKHCSRLQRLTIKHHDDNFVCPIIRGCGRSLKYFEYSECFVTENILSTIFDYTFDLESLIITEHKHNTHRPKAMLLRFHDFMVRSAKTLHHLVLTGVEVEDSSIAEIAKYAHRLNFLSLGRVNSTRDEGTIIQQLRAQRSNLRSVHISMVKSWEHK